MGDVDRWVGEGSNVSIATITGTRRSAPRPPSAKMAINNRGEVSGMVFGSCVEAP